MIDDVSERIGASDRGMMLASERRCEQVLVYLSVNAKVRVVDAKDEACR